MRRHPLPLPGGLGSRGPLGGQRVSRAVVESLFAMTRPTTYYYAPNQRVMARPRVTAA